MTILVLQLRRLGDVLMTTPMLRAIKGALPSAVVRVSVEPLSAPAVRHNPHADGLELTEPGGYIGLAWRLRRARYDVVIDTIGTPASARLALLSGAPMRIGRAGRWRTACYTHALPPEAGPAYSAAAKLALLQPLGIRSDDCRIELFPTEAESREADRYWSSLGLPDGQPVVAFSPVSRRSRKVWPPERFADVCDRWAARAGLRYLPIFAPGEEPQVQRVIARLRHPGAVIRPAPRLTFGALAPLMRRCAFYLGNDNGARHAAIAAGIPTAAVFGPADPASWTPPASPRHVHAGGRRPIDSVLVPEVDALLPAVLAASGLVTSGIATQASGAAEVKAGQPG